MFKQSKLWCATQLTLEGPPGQTAVSEQTYFVAVVGEGTASTKRQMGFLLLRRKLGCSQAIKRPFGSAIDVPVEMRRF